MCFLCTDFDEIGFQDCKFLIYFYCFLNLLIQTFVIIFSILGC